MTCRHHSKAAAVCMAQICVTDAERLQTCQLLVKPAITGPTAFCYCRGANNSSRSTHSMILDSIFEKENYGKGWLGYDVMPRASQAIFVELLVSASIATAVVLTPLMRRVVTKLWHDKEFTWHTPMLAGQHCANSSLH